MLHSLEKGYAERKKKKEKTIPLHGKDGAEVPYCLMREKYAISKKDRRERGEKGRKRCPCILAGKKWP